MFVISGRVFFRDRLEPLRIGIEDGRIVAVKKLLRGEKEVDVGEALVLPGGVDLHVHLREPGQEDKEDFASGTRSAALGGVTTVLDMPNTEPPVTTSAALAAKIARIRGRANVDYGLYAAPRTGSAVPRLLDATAFKVYLAETTGNLEIDEGVAADVLARAGEARKLVSVHAEDPRELGGKKAAGLKEHDTARPKSAEVSAIKKLHGLRGEGPLHIAHVTSVEGLEAVPSGATTEATPHHLLLDWKRPLGRFGKVNPPLRSPEDRTALWKAFTEGRIDAIASDHAPHTREDKEEGRFEESPAGVPGVGTGLPLLLRIVKAGDLSLERFVATTATRPAEILGVEKGAIEIGREADLLVVDPRRIERVTARRARYKCGWTPFDGYEGVFPRAVYVRGEAVVEGGEPSAEGIGRMITNPKR